ncbi:MAG: DUF4160 domain-containing protein [Campylobacterales bacterium]
MYCAPDEHNPQHIHVYYNDCVGILDLNNCEFTEGNLPRKQRKLVEAWAELHKDELLADWNLAQNGELPFPIDPLK